MPKYENYSPNIPTTDYTPDPPAVEDMPPVTPQPVRRGRRRTIPNTESSESRRKPGSSQAAGRSAAPVQKEPFFTRLGNALTSRASQCVAGIILGGLGFWFAVAFLSYLSNCIADQSMVLSHPLGVAGKIGNDAGEGGARLTELLINRGFGVGSLVIVVWLICMSMKLLVGYPKFRTLDFTIKSLIALITLSVVMGMLTIGLDTPVNWGGLHGRLINERIYGFVGWSGAFILSIVLIAIFVVICLRDVIKWILAKKRIYDERRRIQREAEEAEMKKQEEIKEMERREEMDQALSGEGMSHDRDVADKIADSVQFDPESDTIFDTPPDPEDEVLTIDDPFENLSPIDDTIEIEEEDEQKFDNQLSSELPAETSDDSEQQSPTISHPETPGVALSDGVDTSNSSESPVEADSNENADKEASTDVMTVNVNQIEKGSASKPVSEESNLFTHEYKFPPTSYLRPGNDKISVDADEQIENKEKIRKTLLDFGIPITSIEATVGPTVTLYEIRPENGVKIAKIRNLVDDIALSLAAIGVRIIAPIPGKGTVGIEVANKDPQTVSMRTIIQSKAYQDSKFKLPVALGSTISNDVYIADLAKMPHLLVAGATGQGKSVGLNAIITSLLYSKRPEELKFVMVDPKRVEFSLYSKIEKYYLAEIPNSEQPIITNMENVVATLSSLCVEMDERYKLLEKAYVRQVSEYNEKFRQRKLDPREGHRFMPYIVVIIDEFADLIMTAGKEVEVPIARLAQLARAVGIHVIIATQRPSTNVITGMIKANFPVRIAFKVSSGVDSKTILDSTGAQQLIGRGDMLISNNGEMIRVQCAFVDTPEVEEVCDYIARQPYPQGAYILPEPQISGDGDSGDIDPTSLGKKDPLLEEVARQVVMSGTASTSAVQRRYEIGYNRAGRIMDQLQAYGIVGPATGGKPRDVLVDSVTLESILASI